MFVVCGHILGQEGGIQGWGQKFMLDCVVVHPVGQRGAGHGDGHWAGSVAVVVGQNAGQDGGWHGCGHICCVSFSGEK